MTDKCLLAHNLRISAISLPVIHAEDNRADRIKMGLETRPVKATGLIVLLYNDKRGLFCRCIWGSLHYKIKYEILHLKFWNTKFE